ESWDRSRPARRPGWRYGHNGRSGPAGCSSSAFLDLAWGAAFGRFFRGDHGSGLPRPRALLDGLFWLRLVGHPHPGTDGGEAALLAQRLAGVADLPAVKDHVMAKQRPLLLGNQGIQVALDLDRV